MSKFCVSCGNQLQDNEIFCGKCGAQNQNFEPSPANQPAPEVEPSAQVKPNKLIAMAVAAFLSLAVLVVTFIIILPSLGDKGYEKAVKNLWIFISNGNTDMLDVLAPEEYWDALEKEAGFSKDEFAETYEESFKDISDRYRFIDYSIDDVEKLDKEDVKELADILEDTYDIDDKSVKRAVELELKFEYRVDGKKETEKSDLVAVKIDNSWYLVNYDEDNEKVYFAFG